MATSVRVIGGGCGSSWIQSKDSKTKMGIRKSDRVRVAVFCVASSASAVSDAYKTLRIRRGASQSEVKKAFRKLALQYHPDVCKESNSGVQFNCIYEAYDILMNNLKEEASSGAKKKKNGQRAYTEVEQRMNDPDYELWEEWMGWEGGGIRDYSSHINPYI